MDWNEAIEELEGKRRQAKLGGGQTAIDKQHEKGKLTARERLDILFDEGTFVEINDLAESRIDDFGLDKKRVPGDGVITGYGTINNALVYVYRIRIVRGFYGYRRKSRRIPFQKDCSHTGYGT